MPWVLLGLRANPRQDDGILTFQATFGADPVLPGALLDSPEGSELQVADSLRRLREALPVRVPPPPPPSNVPAGLTHMYVREDGPKKSALAPLYRGPFKVLRQLKNTVRLQMGEEEQTVSLARIKPCWTLAPVLVEVPKRGHPAGEG